MKRFIPIIMALVALSAFAAPKEITFLSAPFGSLDGRPAYALERFAKDFPDVKVKHLIVDLSDGSTLTMDAMLAAGTAPNLYMDTLVRTSKYIVPEFAAPLNGLVRDLGKYQGGILDEYTRAGKVLALPTPGGAQGMCINLDMMADIGYVVPDRWTIADFLTMAEKVKQKYGGKKWATGMFAANQSGDYLINNWFASFGVNRYEKGDYTRAQVVKNGGAKVYEFFQTLARSGYIPPGSATLNDDDYCAQWANGELAATAFFPAWMDPYWKTAMEQGTIDKPFRVAYVPFPRAPGVANVATYSSTAALVVHKAGTEQDLWAARLAEYLNDATAQGMQVTLGNLANRTDITAKSDNPYLAQVAKIVAAGGYMDVGLTSPKFAATRPQHFPVLQKVLTLKATPAEAIKEYEARLNEALK